MAFAPTGHEGRRRSSSRQRSVRPVSIPTSHSTPLHQSAIIMNAKSRFNCRFIGTMLLLIVACVTTAQSQGVEPRKHDYSRMARPWLTEKFKAEREKSDWDRYVLGGPISHDNGFFLNSNTIVETPAQSFPQNESSIAISPID